MHRVSIEAGATLLTADISASMPLPDKDSNLDLLDQNQASLPLDHPGKLFLGTIQFDDLISPLQRVLCSNPSRLRLRPKFKIVWALVVTNAVLMMHSFTKKKIPTKQFLHYQNVLEDVVVFAICTAWVFRDSVHAVPGTVFDYPTLSHHDWLV